jgi:adenine C2-methylase RlmN of 23S rRNA A2503 and tRNA A37
VCGGSFIRKQRNLVKEVTTEKFDYKVLWNKLHGIREDWFDGKENLGPEINTELLARYGEEGWEVVATMQMAAGATHKIILKRRRVPASSE